MDISVLSSTAAVLVVLGERARPVAQLMWFVALWRGARYVYDNPGVLSSTFVIDMDGDRG